MSVFCLLSARSNPACSRLFRTVDCASGPRLPRTADPSLRPSASFASSSVALQVQQSRSQTLVAVFVRRLLDRPRRARRHACARAPGRAALARRSCSACVGALARPRDAEVKCALDFCRRSSFVSRVFSSVVPCGARKRRAHRDGPPLARRARARAHHGWFITAAVEQGLYRAGSSFLVLSSCRRSSFLSRVFSLVAVPCGARERRAHRDGQRARDARSANASRVVPHRRNRPGGARALLCVRIGRLFLSSSLVDPRAPLPRSTPRAGGRRARRAHERLRK